MDSIRETEPVIDQTFRGIPPAVRVQDHDEEIAIILRDFSDQASAGFGGESGLHPYHARDAPK